MKSNTIRQEKFQTKLVNKLSKIWIIINAVVMTAGIFMYTPISVNRWIENIITVSCIGLTSLLFNHFQHSKTATYVLSIGMFLHITHLAYTGGGTTLPGILNYIPVILTTGFLLDRKQGFIMAVLSVLAIFGIALLETNNLLPKINFVRSPMGRAIAITLPILVTTAIQYFAVGHLKNSLLALKSEIKKRKKAVKVKEQTVYNLQERVKELKTLYAVSSILQDEDTAYDILFSKIAETIPKGWQYSDIAASRVSIAENDYYSINYKSSKHSLKVEMKTTKGTRVALEVCYIQDPPVFNKDSFLQEEHHLIKVLVEMLKINLEWRERRAELEDYKYALDVASGVCISDIQGTFTFVNENYSKLSKYKPEELIDKNHSILWSTYHSPEYFSDLESRIKTGKPYRGEFCNKAKDGTLYWIDSSIVPLLDQNGKTHQYLSINYDITERKVAEEKNKEADKLLRKITSQVPSNTYMFELYKNGQPKMLFMNRGTGTYNDSVDFSDLEKTPTQLIDNIHLDDKIQFQEALKVAYESKSAISFQYRIIVNEEIKWRWMQAIPEKDSKGKVIWYGATSDITPLVDYIASIEQIIFDISHVIRIPISSMTGMTQLIIDNQLTEPEIKEISKKLHLISKQMDQFITELNHVYNQKRHDTTLSIDTSTLIDKRGFLFT